MSNGRPWVVKLLFCDMKILNSEYWVSQIRYDEVGWATRSLLKEYLSSLYSWQNELTDVFWFVKNPHNVLLYGLKNASMCIEKAPWYIEESCHFLYLFNFDVSLLWLTKWHCFLLNPLFRPSWWMDLTLPQ